MFWAVVEQVKWIHKSALQVQFYTFPLGEISPLKDHDVMTSTSDECNLGRSSTKVVLC